MGIFGEVWKVDGAVRGVGDDCVREKAKGAAVEAGGDDEKVVVFVLSGLEANFHTLSGLAELGGTFQAEPSLQVGGSKICESDSTKRKPVSVSV